MNDGPSLLPEAIIVKEDPEHNSSLELLKKKIQEALKLLSEGIIETPITAEDLIEAAKVGNIEILNSLLRLPSAGRLLVTLKDRPEFPLLVDIFRNAPLCAHLAVATGDLDFIKLIISDENVNAKSRSGKTPLFFAINTETIDYLLEHQANPYVTSESFDAITWMRNLQPPSLVNHLKKRIGFADKVLDEFYIKIKPLIKHELVTAKKHGKRLLILMGEAHHYYPIYQVEKLILKTAAELGISSLLVELKPKAVEDLLKKDVVCAHAVQLMKNAKNKFGMLVEGIDRNKVKIVNSETIEVRDMAMKEEILKRDNHAIAIVGINHLNGLLNVKETRITERNLIRKEKYHLLPFNLFKLFEKISKIYNVHLDNVIEVDCTPELSEITLSEPSKAVEYWNPISDNFTMQKREAATRKIQREYFKRRERFVISASLGNINALDRLDREERRRALLKASENNRPKVVKMFLEKGALPTKYFKYALSSASRHGHVDIMLTVILHAGHLIPAKDKSYAFQTAASEGHLDFVKMYVRIGIEIFSEDVMYAIKRSAWSGKNEVLTYLLDEFHTQISPSIKGEFLIATARANQTIALNILLEKIGKDISIKDFKKAHLWALLNKNQDLADILSKYMLENSKILSSSLPSAVISFSEVPSAEILPAFKRQSNNGKAKRRCKDQAEVATLLQDAVIPLCHSQRSAAREEVAGSVKADFVIKRRCRRVS